ncbi:hypothetical protein MNBD_IGNAVI01-1493 [hydrothermal vent metagenome]|uniref:Uncharacterized protein n=1 Tax=hydrothermal vent metagenome TaxID=652676 RepID=A0A3B1C8V5_9ZZZZ
MTLKKLLLYILFFAAVTSSSGQVVGKIFDAEYANENFGSVISSVVISNIELREMLEKAGTYIMLNIDTGNIRALDENRTPVHGTAESENEVFYKISTSRIELLFEKGGEKNTTIEMRPEILTLTNGEFTLDLTWPCPPYCD